MIKCEIQERGLGGGRKFGDTGRETEMTFLVLWEEEITSK